MNQDYLIKKKPMYALALFALPMIIGNLFQQTYTMVDSAIVGRYVSEQALAAVGASYSLTNVFICVAIGGGMGASVVVSRHFGAKAYDRMKTAVYTALLTFLVISILLGSVGLLCGKWIMNLLQTPSDVLDLSVVYGISNLDPGAIERHRAELGLMNCKTMTAVIPEGTRQLAERPLKEVAKTLAFNLNPDTMLVYSTTPGSSIDVEQVSTIKEVTDTPVFASNGVKAETVEEILSVADGAIVATSVKYDGKFFNAVDPERVKALMERAKAARGDK